MNRFVCAVVWIVVCAAAASRAIAQVEPGIEAIEQRISGVTARLEALEPANARAYFELGEEVGAERDLRPARVLATRLIGLAFVLEQGKEDKADRGLLASCCLALAPLAESEGDRRWLRALADVVGDPQSRASSRSGQERGTETSASPDDDVALDAASVLGLARAGQGQRAVRLLQRPGVAYALERYERLLSPALLPGGMGRVRSMIEEWQGCQTCRNRRVQKDAGGIRLCSRCGGRPGPRLTDMELVLQLRTEAALLNGVQKSWAASTLVDAGAPVRDADPAQLAEILGIDTNATVFRGGQWKQPEAAPVKKASPVEQPTREDRRAPAS